MSTSISTTQASTTDFPWLPFLLSTSLQSCFSTATIFSLSFITLPLLSKAIVFILFVSVICLCLKCSSVCVSLLQRFLLLFCLSNPLLLHLSHIPSAKARLGNVEQLSVFCPFFFFFCSDLAGQP